MNEIEELGLVLLKVLSWDGALADAVVVLVLTLRHVSGSILYIHHPFSSCPEDDIERIHLGKDSRR